ncbi:12540_t:CDS:1, partial [Gigaspora margarita]
MILLLVIALGGIRFIVELFESFEFLFAITNVLPNMFVIRAITLGVIGFIVFEYVSLHL